MDDRRNYLDLPENPTFKEALDYALADMFRGPESAFPVYPDAERSTHPMWKDWDEVSRYLHAVRDGEDVSGYEIVKVFSVKTVDWTEFLDTVAGNSDHDGLVAEVERADGWTGRYCIEISLAKAISALQETLR
jgi:hypothetical protein